MKKHLLQILLLILLTAICLTGCDISSDGAPFIPAYKDAGDSAQEKDTESESKNTGNSQVTSKKRVALTLDDGPHNVYTKKIVDELSKYGFNATFFVVGNRVDGTAYNGSSALKYAAEAGNELAIHGYTHEHYYDKCEDSVYQNELSKTESAILAKVPNANIKLMRPVGGRITDNRVNSSEYSVIMWSVDSEDWKHKYYSDTDEAVKKQKLDTIVDNVLNSVSDGDIILMHDIYLSTYDATVIILKELYEQGYEVVTVSELLGSNISAGKKYSKAPKQ